MSRKRVLGGVLLAALLLGAVPAEAGKKWKGRLAPRKGTVHRLTLTTDVTVSAKLPLIGGPEGRLHLRVDSTRRVAQRSRRGPSSIELTLDRIAFDFDLAGQATTYDSAQADAAESGASPLVGEYVGLLLGRTLTLEVLRTGEIAAVHGIDDLYAEVERLSGEESAIAALLGSLTRDLGAVALKAVLQQATPVFPGRRVRIGDAWSREADLPNPLFEAMRSASSYEFQEIGRHADRKAVRTAVQQVLSPTGQGPLLEQLGRLAGLKGEVRLEDGEATGSATVWSERKTGLTLQLQMEQRVRATLSIPVSVLGFTRRTRVPLKVDQTVSLTHLAAESASP